MAVPPSKSDNVGFLAAADWPVSVNDTAPMIGQSAIGNRQSAMPKTVTAQFVKSAFQESDWPPDSLPEVAFLGRSNVGKSSLINSLLGTKGLARTSSTPGRTQALNFFLVNDRFRFVDLPGFGYARVPEKIRSSWSNMVTTYLAKRSQLVLSIHIVDSRHEPTRQDLQLHEWLEHYARPHLIVATKSDKLSNNELRKNIGRVKRLLEKDRPIIYSAKTGVGRDQVWQAIKNALTGARFAY